MAVSDTNNKSLYGSGEVVKDSVNESVTQAEAAEAGAKQARDDALGHSQDAAQSVLDCEAQVSLAQDEVALANIARTGAETAETNAVLAQGSAELAQSLAETAQAAAEVAQAGAEQAEADTLVIKNDAVSETTAIKDDTQAILDEFNELYWGALPLPPTDPAVTVGDLYFDTTEQDMKVCSQTGPAVWIAAASAGVLESVDETISVEGKTTFTIAYKPSLGCLVFVNGVHLSSDDYTATTGTEIVLDEGLSVGEHIHITGFQSLDLYDAYQRDEIDALLADKVSTDATYKPNLLMNGDFQVWQRGPTLVGSGYGADRWLGYVDHSMNRSTDVPDITSTYSCLLSNASAPGDLMITRQAVELLAQGESAPFNINKTYTMSGWVKASGGNTVTLRLAYVDSNGGTANRVIVETEDIIPNASGAWQKFEHTFTLSADPNPSNLAMEVLVYIAGINSATDNMRLAELKLEESPVATPFVSRPYGEELALCQRYYWRGKALGIGGGYLYGTTSTSNMTGTFGSFPVRMRAIPSVVIVTEPTYVQCTHTDFQISDESFVHRVSPTVTGHIRAFNGVYEAIAEF